MIAKMTIVLKHLGKTAMLPLQLIAYAPTNQQYTGEIDTRHIPEVGSARKIPTRRRYAGVRIS